MRSEFQDVFKDAYDHWIDDACSHRYNASKSLALQVWQHQQSKVDELQKRVDAAHDTLTELKEKSEALHHRWQIFSDSVALAEAEMIDMCVKELEQALKGGNA